MDKRVPPSFYSDVLDTLLDIVNDRKYCNVDNAAHGLSAVWTHIEDSIAAVNAGYDPKHASIANTILKFVKLGTVPMSEDAAAIYDTWLSLTYLIEGMAFLALSGVEAKGDGEIAELTHTLKAMEEKLRARDVAAKKAVRQKLESDIRTVKTIWEKENTKGDLPTNVDQAVVGVIKRLNNQVADPKKKIPDSEKTISRYRLAGWNAAEYVRQADGRRASARQRKSQGK